MAFTHAILDGEYDKNKKIPKKLISSPSPQKWIFQTIDIVLFY